MATPIIAYLTKGQNLRETSDGIIFGSQTYVVAGTQDVDLALTFVPKYNDKYPKSTAQDPDIWVRSIRAYIPSDMIAVIVDIVYSNTILPPPGSGSEKVSTTYDLTAKQITMTVDLDGNIVGSCQNPGCPMIMPELTFQWTGLTYSFNQLTYTNVMNCANMSKWNGANPGMIILREIVEAQRRRMVGSLIEWIITFKFEYASYRKVFGFSGRQPGDRYFWLPSQIDSIKLASICRERKTDPCKTISVSQSGSSTTCADDIYPRVNFDVLFANMRWL